MSPQSRGLGPANKCLLSLIALLAVNLPLGARADDGMVDVRTLPRLQGSVDDPTHTEQYTLQYGMSTTVPVTTAAARKLLSDAGWVSFARPLDENSTSLALKKSKQGLIVNFSQGLGRPDQSAVYYTALRITSNVPFPPDATDIVYDENRPYLGCVAPAAVDATMSFFEKELAAIGWQKLSAEDAAARWPNANLAENVAGGVRAYYTDADDDSFYRQRPIMLTLQKRDDGRTNVDIRVAPFALPQTLEADSDMAGLPKPKSTKSASGRGSLDWPRRDLVAAVLAEPPAVLAFYRRELAARHWSEDTSGAVVTPDGATLSFSSPEETATLKLSRKYDMTIVELKAQVTQQALAARAKAKKEADDKFMRDAEATAKQIMAADEARRKALAANLSDAPIHAAADSATPVPLPDNAEDIKFDGAEGRLEFNSGSSVNALATFYRSALKSQGWKEQPSVINKPTMVVMEFAKGGKELSFTAMQMGAKVNVSGEGAGLKMAKAASPIAKSQAPGGAATTANEALEADPDSALPVPKQHSTSSVSTGSLPGSDTAFRRELQASVPAGLSAALAFYRSELAKRGWNEEAGRARIGANEAQLAFTAPDGPVTLRLARKDGETTIDLVQKMPAVAAQSDVMPKAGRARLLLGNLGGSDAALTIKGQTVRIAAGAGGPHAKGPVLDLPPGKYSYSVKLAGRPVRNGDIELAADDAWGLMIAPDGEAVRLQVY